MTCPLPRPVRTVRLRVIENHRHPKDYELPQFHIDILAAAELTSDQLRRELVEALPQYDRAPRPPRDPEHFTLTLDLDASTPDEPVLILDGRQKVVS